jgi:hypothetical protein
MELLSKQLIHHDLNLKITVQPEFYKHLSPIFMTPWAP